MTNNKPVQVEDVVLVLSGYPFSAIVGSKGVVQQSMQTGLAVVYFQQEKRWHDPSNLEVYSAKSWLIPWKYIKVLDSAYGNSLGELEQKLESLEDDLVVSKCCLELSEQLREMQHETIEKLKVEIDMLRAEIYYLKGGR